MGVGWVRWQVGKHKEKINVTSQYNFILLYLFIIGSKLAIELETSKTTPVYSLEQTKKKKSHNQSHVRRCSEVTRSLSHFTHRLRCNFIATRRIERERRGSERRED